ncbi:uncharacterized protein LOC136094507 [Hydra vulgaris]|uniref:uncharacterized protein LOC136094507 n=1 Tax=Hydra vulgaris TaxID=6087 RepID=UPI0032EA8B0A
MPKVKVAITRMKSEKKYCGGPCELSTTDPSTFRQVIQYYYYLIHINPNADILLVTQQISNNIKSIWATVNPRLPLKTDKSINRKVKDLLVLVKDINRKHGKASAKRNLDANLDKLFDISACSCSLDVCISTFSVDRLSVKRIQRLDKERQKISHKLVNEDESLIAQVNLIEETSGLTNTEDEGEWKPVNNPIGKYNLVKLPRFAMELVRNECSSNVGAALANALLHDIKHLLKNDVDIKDILIDKCKLDRAKSKVKIVSEEVDSEQKKTRINNLPFDDVKYIVKKNIKNNASCLKPENILYAMLKDNDSKIRNLGFQILLGLRQRVNIESLEVNLKKIPEINSNANHWYELVDISITKFTEPPTTQHFSIEQIQYAIDNIYIYLFHLTPRVLSER